MNTWSLPALSEVSLHHAALLRILCSSSWVTRQDIYLHLSHCGAPLAYIHRPCLFILLNAYTNLWAETAVRNRQIFYVCDCNMKQGVETCISASSLQQHPSARNFMLQFYMTVRTALWQATAASLLFSSFVLNSIIASGWAHSSIFIQRKTLPVNLFINCLQNYFFCQIKQINRLALYG